MKYINEKNNKMFLLSAFALALICSVQGEEKQHSARWNRTRSAEEAIVRVCDMYVPNGINEIDLNEVWDILDGPVLEVLNKHSETFKGVMICTEEAGLEDNTKKV